MLPPKQMFLIVFALCCRCLRLDCIRRK